LGGRAGAPSPVTRGPVAAPAENRYRASATQGKKSPPASFTVAISAHVPIDRQSPG